MDKKSITHSNVIDLLEKAVEKRGKDYKYKEHYMWCQYFAESNGQPMCLIGLVLFDIGIRLRHFRELEIDNDTSILHALEDGLGNILEIDNAALSALDAAQSKQDKGEPWGEALKHAKGTLEAYMELGEGLD